MTKNIDSNKLTSLDEYKLSYLKSRAAASFCWKKLNQVCSQNKKLLTTNYNT